MKLWVVWEANASHPAVFTTEEKAIAYRTKRMRMIRHQVYISEQGVDQ